MRRDAKYYAGMAQALQDTLPKYVYDDKYAQNNKQLADCRQRRRDAILKASQLMREEA